MMMLLLLTLCCFFTRLVSGLVTASPEVLASKSLPTTYRALLAEATGQSFSQVAQVGTLPIPSSIDEDEILVQVKYAGVNGGCETFRARGEYSFESNTKATEPFSLGAEGVGIIAAVGSSANKDSDLAVGDAVCFVGSAFAEYSKCKTATVWKIPEASPEYVGLRISGLTACAMLEQTGKLQRGEVVLITAAAGGAGHFAVQFAKLAGCKVIGTCGSQRKAEVLQQLGCDHVINYKNQDVAAELKRLAPNGLDAAFEGVGGSMLQIALDNLAPEGRLLQVGYISEYPHNPEAEVESSKNEVNASELFWNKQTIKRGKQTIYGNAWPEDYGSVAGCKDRVLGLFAEGKLKSLIDDTDEFVGLDSVSDAIKHMLSSNTIGKVVVKIQ